MPPLPPDAECAITVHAAVTLLNAIFTAFAAALVIWTRKRPS